MSGWQRLDGGSDGCTYDFLSLLAKSESPRKMNNGLSEILFSPSPRKMPVHDHDAFCNQENLSQCVAYLNQEITTMGMPSLFSGGNMEYDIVRIVNCLHDLLQKHQRSSRLREELENRIHRMESDESHHRLSHNRLKSTLQQTQRELVSSEEKVRQLTNKNKLLAVKLKTEKEEVRRLQSEGNHRYTQFKHDLKKKEREAVKLKERLNQLLSDKCQEKKIGMEISQVIQRGDGKRGTWQKPQEQNNELQRELISHYDHRQKELMIENSGLRQCLSTCLSTLQKEIVALFKDDSTSQHHTDLCEIDDDASVDSVLELTEAHFEMPCDFMRENLEKNMQDKCKLLKKYIKRVTKKEDLVDGEDATSMSDSSPPMSELHQKEVERLRKQIKRYQDIIDQQEQIIYQTFTTTTTTTNSEEPVENLEPPKRQDEADLEEERQTLAAERALFSEQQANFEKERKSFTEAAIRLGREREAFENDRSNFLTQQIMQMTPFKSKTTLKISPRNARTTGSEKAQLVPAASVFSPAPNMKVTLSTPTTADLYRTLGLTPRIAKNHLAEVFSSPSLKPSPTLSCSPSSPTTSGTDQALSGSTPRSARSTSEQHNSRVSEHALNVKMAVFNRGSLGCLATSPEQPPSGPLA